MGRKKAIVSACLLGERVRYDGKTKKDDVLLKALAAYDIIPFCPEDPIMGTPRARISVVKIDGEQKVIVDTTKVEVTTALKLQTEMLIDAHGDADIVILKSKSPSCGLGTTPILDREGNEIEKGNGVAAELLSKKFAGKIFDEHTIHQIVNL